MHFDLINLIIMTFVGLITGVFITTWYGFRSHHKSIAPLEAINVIEGIVLPDADDPRWYVIYGGDTVKLGDIEVDDKNVYFILETGKTWISSNRVSKYNSEIFKGIHNRLAEEAILNAKMPPKAKRKPKVVNSLIPEVKELKEVLEVKALPSKTLIDICHKCTYGEWNCICNKEDAKDALAKGFFSR